MAAFMIGIVGLASYATGVLREEMQRQLGEQQFSTVSLLATKINDELSDRIKALEIVAETSIPSTVRTF